MSAPPGTPSSLRRRAPRALRRAVAVAALAGFACLLAPGAAIATAPWWQLSTGARPENLWLPKSEVQELSSASNISLRVEGKPVGGLLPPGTTAAQMQSLLEGAYGAGNVEVTGGPLATAPLRVTSIGADADRYVAPIESVTEGGAKVLVEGGSGRLFLTATDIGDAAVQGASEPITVTDTLPGGLSAFHVEASAGALGRAGPTSCAINSTSEVSCTFAGALPPYEAIEVEIWVSLTGPAASVAPGEATVSGGDAPPVGAVQPVSISDAPVPFGVEGYSLAAEEEGGAPATQAGSHPFQLTATIQLNQGPLTPGATRRETLEEQPALPRNFRVKLPAGLVGNATAMPRCSYQQFTEAPEGISNCPTSSAVGVASVTLIEHQNFGLTRLAVPIFNLAPARGEPARFGFSILGAKGVLDTGLRSGEGYGVTVRVDNTPEGAQVLASTLVFWGEPGDPRHDESRGWACSYHAGSNLGPCTPPQERQAKPLLRLPTSCGARLGFPLELEPWNLPLGSEITDASFTGGAIDGCSREPFLPSLEVEPGTQSAETPSGLTVHLRVPQEASEVPGGISESDVRNTRVTLPAGLHVNPAAANGLQACSEAQMGFERVDPRTGEAVFDEEPAGCPEDAKLGTVKITSPLLEEPVSGSVYQAAQGANPFGSLLALYVVAEAPGAGIRVKLAGEVEPSAAGQLVSSFDETPQLPFEEFELHLFGGDNGPLLTAGCGGYRTEAEIEPWSGNAAVAPSSEFQVTSGPNGGACPSPGPFAPSFSAGSESPFAGAYSPFVLHLGREDGSQQFSRIDTVLPAGLSARLAGVPYCRDADLAAAEAKSGAAERENPSCPAASRVGTVDVAAGAGPDPVHVQGSAYLAGPYKGAPLSLAIVTPAVAGPFDLGTVVVRTALYVNPETAQVTAESDPIPTILDGIPLDVRSIAVEMSRPEFTLNPTSCAAKSVGGEAISTLGQSAPLSEHFQVGGCKGLAFKPKLALKLNGSTKRAGNPALTATLTMPPGGANIASAQVTLPHSAFLDNAHIKEVCTRPQLASHTCPAGSVYGHAKAVTPLLEKPLEGNVYLGTGFGYKLPALVADLSGQIEVLLHGKVDTGREHGIRNTFEVVPDAPVTKFTLSMDGGRKSLIELSENLCSPKAKTKALAKFVGQNGKAYEFEPTVANGCGTDPAKHDRRSGK